MCFLAPAPHHNSTWHVPPVQDLTYTVKSHHDRKVQVSLLTSVSGFFNPGQMSALVRCLPLRITISSQGRLGFIKQL